MKRVDFARPLRYKHPHLSYNSDFMCCSFQSFPCVKRAKTWLTIGLVTSVVSVCDVAFADPVGPASAASVPANSESLGITLFWAGAALFACVVAAGGVIVAPKFHQ